MPKRKSTIALEPMKRMLLKVTIRGITSLLQNKMKDAVIDDLDARARGESRQKNATKEAQADWQGTVHRTQEGRFGHPAVAIHDAIASATSLESAVSQKVVNTCIFVLGDILPINKVEPHERRDVITGEVRGKPVAALSYRAEYDAGWEIPLEIEFDSSNVTLDQLLALLNRAGYSIGIGAFRPERKGKGIHGRFKIVPGSLEIVEL